MSRSEIIAPCRNERALADGESTAAMAKRVLELVEAGGSGALVLQRDDGTVVGAVLAEYGRVCWAVCRDCSRRLSDILIGEAPGLTKAVLAELVAECRREQVPLGETLLARGLISLDRLRQGMLRHTCLSLDHLVRSGETGWNWTPHSKQSYSPMLTFSAVEVLAGISYLSEPEACDRALEYLRAAAGPKQSMLALRRVVGGRVPLAHIGGEHLELGRLIALSRQADEMLAIASIAGLHVVVLDLDDLAMVAWGGGSIRYVLLSREKLGFNKLLSHVVSSTVIGNEEMEDGKR